MWWSRRIWINKCTFFRHVAFNFILKSWGFFSVWRVVTGTVTGSVRWICVWLRLYLTEKKSVWEKFYVCIFSTWCECMLPDASKLIDWWCSNEQWMTRKGWNKKVHVVVVGCLEIISLLPPTLRAEDFRRPSAQLFKCLCYFIYLWHWTLEIFFLVLLYFLHRYQSQFSCYLFLYLIRLFRPSVLWHCWLGYVKNVPEMTHYVYCGTLNLTCLL